MSLFQQAPTERWQVVTAPAALPGCCFLCRADSSCRDWFIDLSLQFEFHGAVYVCNECLSELARTVGWITPAQAEVLKEQAETARREAFRLQVANDNFRALEEAINGYVRDRARNRHPSNREPDLVLFPGTEYASESDRDDEVGSPSGADQLGAGEGTSAESSDDSGVDELPPDASDNGEFRLDI